MKTAKTDYFDAVDDIRERILSTLEEKGVTQNSVANGDAPAQKRLNNQLSHGTSLTVDSLLRVMEACPDVSPEWLLRGEGEKYKTDCPHEGDSEEMEDLRIELTKVHAERDEYKQIIEDLKRQAKEWKESDEYKRELEELKKQAEEWKESDEYKQTIEELRAEAADLRARLDEQRTNFRVLAESMGRPTKPTPIFDTSTGTIQIIGASASPRVANAAKRAGIRAAVAEAKAARKSPKTPK